MIVAAMMRSTNRPPKSRMNSDASDMFPLLPDAVSKRHPPTSFGAWCVPEPLPLRGASNLQPRLDACPGLHKGYTVLDPFDDDVSPDLEASVVERSRRDRVCESIRLVANDAGAPAVGRGDDAREGPLQGVSFVNDLGLSGRNRP